MEHVKKLMKIHEEKRQPMEVEAYEFLCAEGIRFPKYFYATNEEEMKEIERILKEKYSGKRFAFKVMSPMILHKSDHLAVHLNVRPEGCFGKFLELKYEFQHLDFKGVLIVPMASDGVELLLGSTFDDTFGLISVFGVGGTLVEVLKDVTFGKAPLNRADATLMLKSIKSQKLLTGPRGLPKLNSFEMIDLMVRISEIAYKYKHIIREIDLNPLRVTNKGIYPLDARIILHTEKC